MNINKREIIEKSYMTKEEFIGMINSIEFTHVKEYDINLIKSWFTEVKDDEDVEIKPLYFNIKGM